MVIFQSEDLSAPTTSKSIPEVIVYDNSNIQKSCSGVTTPLTFNFTKRVYALVFKQTLKSLSLSDKALIKNEEIFQNLVGLIKGRIYYNINNWYRGLQFFHSFNQNKTSLAKIMGLSEPVTFIDDEEKSWWQKCILLWGKLIDLPRLLIVFSTLKTKIPAFFTDINTCYSEFYKQNLDSMGITDLKRQKEKLDKSLLKYWGTPVINDLYILMASGNIAERLLRVGLTNSEELVNNFLSEEQALSNLQPAKHLHRLAVKAASEPELRVLLSRLPKDIHKLVKLRFKEFYKEVMSFIELYGDRTTGELKLETQTMRQNPFIFYCYLKDCLNLQISEIRAGNQSNLLAYNTLEQKLSNVSSINRRNILAKVVKLQKAISFREAFKAEQSRVFGMYRTLYIAFGLFFQKNKWIEKSEDIFYLTEEEILSCGNGQEHIFDTLIATRKQEFEMYKNEELPSRVLVSTKVINAVIKPDVAVPLIQNFDSKVEVA